MSHRRRHIAPKRYLVVGGEHDGKSLDIDSNYYGPLVNNVSIPNAQLPPTEFDAVEITPRAEQDATTYYAHRLRKANYITHPVERQHIEDYWFFCVDEELSGWTDYAIWDQDMIDKVFDRLRKFYYNKG